MGNGSVCWDVGQSSFVFFDVTTSSCALFRWEMLAPALALPKKLSITAAKTTVIGYVYYFAFDIHTCDSKLIVSLVLVLVI